jgi:O-antigen/teichoic acid export membrane protein
MSSLKKIAIQGTLWIFVGYATSQGIRFIGNVILTRLLSPELFGLMTIVNIFLIGLQLFSDVGIGPSIIQNKHGEEEDFRNTAWTIQVIRGFLLWIGCLLIAFPVAAVYEEPQLRWLIPFVGLTTIISGFNSSSIFILERHVAIKKLTFFKVLAQIAGVITMIGLALISPTILALAAGGLVGSLVTMIVSHFLIPENKAKFTWDIKAKNEIFSFGRWIFVATAMTFLANQSDRLILGKLLTLAQLGVYTIAFTLADMPRGIMTRISNGIVFPIAAKKKDIPRSELREKILSQRRLLLLGLAVFVSLLAGLGDILIAFLYDDRYEEATWMMTLLSIGIWPYVLFDTTRPILLAIGRSMYEALANFLRFTSISVGIVAGFHFFGLVGAIVVLAFSDVPLYIANQYGLFKEGLTCYRQDFLMTLFFISCLALLFTTRVLAGYPPALFSLFG